MVKRWDRLSHTQQLKLRLKATKDPTFFMENEWFNGVELFPRQKLLAMQVYDMRRNRGIFELIVAWGRRSGKTMMGSHFLSYGLYELLELPNPQRRFGLAPKSPIELDAVAKSAKQSKRTAFKQLKARIYTNPYFVHLENIGLINVLSEEIATYLVKNQNHILECLLFFSTFYFILLHFPKFHGISVGGGATFINNNLCMFCWLLLFNG